MDSTFVKSYAEKSILLVDGEGAVLLGVSSRGYPRLFQGGYIYTYHRSQGPAEYWRCSKRKYCHGRLVRRYGMYKITHGHDCTPQQKDDVLMLAAPTDPSTYQYDDDNEDIVMLN